VAAGRRVAILDYDAHHGNGTRDIFAENPAVLYVSTHEYGIYPGTGPAEDTGTGEGRGFTVNIPFTAGCGDASYVAALDSVIEPILGQFRPDVVLVSLGIDAHYRDPLTSLTLSSPGYVDLVKRSAALAARLCANRFTIRLCKTSRRPFNAAWRSQSKWWAWYTRCAVVNRARSEYLNRSPSGLYFWKWIANVLGSTSSAIRRISFWMTAYISSYASGGSSSRPLISTNSWSLSRRPARNCIKSWAVMMPTGSSFSVTTTEE